VPKGVERNRQKFSQVLELPKRAAAVLNARAVIAQMFTGAFRFVTGAFRVNIVVNRA